MKTATDYTNHLAGETSPYLLQHAGNPVEWYPWCDRALQRARREQRPILLSIGYSACHWCHVMAHESFENPDTAALMNRYFINIKVDREERPDLDRIYQSAHSLLTQRPGGWPLTVFLTPEDQVPFFAGTYFPDRPRHGMPSFSELLLRIVDYLNHHADSIAEQNRTLVSALQDMERSRTADSLDSRPLDSARQALDKLYDPRDGGFGEPPKFPHPTHLERLLRHWSRSRDNGQADARALHMVTDTLAKMARGGLFDQLGGGFCRYSVDRHWMIPHFEKMLYDNGALLALYAQAHAASGEPLFARICHQTADWVMREMQTAEGGYCSSLDADSEGEEGRYYVWTPEQVRQHLDDADYALFARRYGLDRVANFEGRWHLHVACTREQLARELSRDPADIDADLARAQRKLLAARGQRTRPGRDDKILTAWNALMIRGMAIAGRHLDVPEWIASAQRALDFICGTLWKDGRLLATYKDGRAHLNGYLDDYAFLADAILELLQVRWRDGDLELAIRLMECVLQHFRDDCGGFYFTSDDHEPLIQRPKPAWDDAIPSGNGIAAKVLLRLGHLLGETRYLAAAEETLKVFWQDIESMPHAHASLLDALEESLLPSQTVVIRIDGNDGDDWYNAAARPYAPARLTLSIPAQADKLPAQLAQHSAATGSSVAWICSATACSAPIQRLDQFLSALHNHGTLTDHE